MREILFKAKRVDNGEWVEGDFFHFYFRGRPTSSAIISGEGYEHSIHRSTLCQFTGLLDKNENKIFEGDIIIACSYTYHEPVDEFTGEVVLGGSNGISLFALEDNRTGTMNDFIELSSIWAEYKVEYEIIGNIHDSEV